MYNDSEQRQYNAVAQDLKQLASHPHSEVQQQTSGCIVCGKAYKQVLEEATTKNLQKTVELAETVRERHLKRQAFIAGGQCGVKAFILLGVSQANTCDGIIYSINKANTNQEAQENFLPLFHQ